jgi:acyl transferase domain-containing protein/NADPH:quinone reductase-like Zn-dependent oxidoreductase/acyl carrier protein/SAM-dependent methyltransferase
MGATFAVFKKSERTFTAVSFLYTSMQDNEPIAITGIGCRFPGGANDPQALWKILVDGLDAVGEVPADRWNVDRFYHAETAIPGKSIAKRGGFIDAIDQFDPQFFGISPREAPFVDPQQRLLLETAWEAIEDAGMVLDFEKGSHIGVFAGVSHTDYQAIQGSPFDRSGVGPHTATGSAHSIAANRISYSFNLLGPSISVDTACSSALTAVHLACQSIRAGNCDTALAGGVTVMIGPEGFIGFSQASMLSTDGKCKAFDASANGFVRGEGAGMVLLKSLSQAIMDGDRIHGLILGTAVNQDGHTNGISLPSPEAQKLVVRDACRDAGIDPLEVSYVEAHGTGTAVGDPIEANALAEALCMNRPENAPLIVGSIKTNLGHLETAAGVAGLVKGVLMLKHRQIPENLHFNTPNPNIDFEGLRLRVPNALEEFPASKEPLVMGVNSFGFGGANAHVVLTESPALAKPAERGADQEGRAWPIVLSARSESSLQRSAADLSEWLKKHENLNGSSPLLSDLTYTLGARRNHHAFRLALTASTIGNLAGELQAYAGGEADPNTRTAFAPRPESPPRVAFVMSGQGPQWWGMGRELMREEPVFRQVIEECDAAMGPWARFSLLEELGKDEETSQMDRTEIAQPCIFAMQMGLTALWKSWGIKPVAIVGHSVGEIAAACAAGILTLEQGAQAIVLRGRCMDECKPANGGMLAVGLAAEDAQVVLSRHDANVSIAAFNGPKSLTLAGPRPSLEKIAAELEADGVFARFVKVDHPFHHELMRPASENIEEELFDVEPRQETVPFFSTVTGGRCAGLNCVSEHWGRGVRQPVQLEPAVDAMDDFGVDLWLEIGAHPALVHSLNECLAARDPDNKAAIVASVRRERERESLLEAVLELHHNAVEIDFVAMTPSRRQLSLPTYAWDKSRWWHESSDWRHSRLSSGGRGFLDIRLPGAVPTWNIRLDARHMAFLKDHKVENMVLFPAAGFVEIVLEAGFELFEGRPFVIEDFEIRKPLILPESTKDLLIEFSYDPNERTFSLQSRFEGGGAWSLHVVGAMRGERTESGFAETTWKSTRPDGLTDISRDDFYDHMSDMGLRYGDEFRGLREVAAGGGKAAGKVALSAEIEGSARDYKVHPVLFDAALHVFSASVKSVENHSSRLRLPVRFARIAFHGSPGASGMVRAEVRHHNEEYVEGRLAMYDAAGKPCLSVDGFRSISVVGARKSGMPGGISELLYHIDWERTPSIAQPGALPPVPLSRLEEVAKVALNEVIELRGRKALETTLVDEDDLVAAQIARGLMEMLEKSALEESFTIQSLGVAEPMQPVCRRLLDGLIARGMLGQSGDGYKLIQPAFSQAAEDADDRLRKFFAKHPGHLSEALLCTSTCGELGEILRGEKEAVQVLFAGVGAELLDQFYGDGLLSSHWLAGIAQAVKEAADNLPEGRGLRILEVGAGTGGLTAQVLPLLERGIHSYVFTDVSAAFFQSAMQKLAAFPEVECKIFDLERPGTDQDFEKESFDLIIGTNVLHAVRDVKETLGHIHNLLTPGGTLMFMETAAAQLWTDAVFGLTSGWWRFTDKELRTDSPLLERLKWEEVLRDSGFSETASLHGLRSPLGVEGQIAVFARKSWCETEVAPDANGAPLEVEGSWLVFVDEAGLGDELVSRLRAAGAPCRVARRGTAFSQHKKAVFELRSEVPEDWQKLIEACGDGGLPDRFVYFWALDETLPTADAEADTMGTDGLLHLTHALEEACPAANLRIDLVTRGAQPVGRDLDGFAVQQAAAIGILRVILAEHPNFLCRGADLPPAASERDVELLWEELLRSEPDREAAFRGEARYVQRMKRGLSSRERLVDSDVPLMLESKERGILDSLRFSPFTMPACGDNDVVIDVKAAGMNFRDVLKALGVYPAESADARIFGDEVAGIVKSVGSKVTHVKPGDRVFGLAVFGLANQTIARAGDIRVLPASLSFEEAATLPVVSMTSLFALRDVARIRKGDRILVQAGAGGVGMAAIQIAHHCGATVIATAGSPTKRQLLTMLGVEHVIDSRRADFAEAVSEITDGKGVDIVLNSMAGEAIPMGLSCLAPFGRFVEIGKRDIYQNSRLPMWPMRQNGSFHVVAMDAVFDGDAALTGQLLDDVIELVDKGALHPLPYRAFPASRVDGAFRLMAQGKHIGKVVVSFADALVVRRAAAQEPGFTVKSDASYLITGAFGGFGRVLANWLVEQGARHLVLAGRREPTEPEALAFLENLRDLGVDAKVVMADAGKPDDVKRLLVEANSPEYPLRGVFHLAMVIDDAPMNVLNHERMLKVMAPKAHGSWLLHEGTKDAELDCFVMFSSVSSILGNPGQANYVSANAFLDSLAHHRQAMGMPALVVNWGALGGEGYVARNERVAEYLSRQGTVPLTPGEVTSLLQRFLEAGVPQAMSLRVDWAKWRQTYRGLQENPLLQYVFAGGGESEEKSGMSSDWRNRIEAASADKRGELIEQAVREIVGQVLRVKPGALRLDQPLTDLGLDSLMAVEMETLIESTIGVALPPASLMQARTIGQLASKIGEFLGKADGGETPEAPEVEPETVATDEVDLAALSDDEVEGLLGDESDPAENDTLEEVRP